MFKVIADATVKAVNLQAEQPEHLIGSTFTHCNSQTVIQKVMTECERGTVDWSKNYYDLDCIVGLALSWGHGPLSQRARLTALGNMSTAWPEQLTEFTARPTEYLSLLDHSFYWLGETDSDSHIPLCVVIRPADTINERKRSEQAALRRAMRPWYQGRKSANAEKEQRGRSSWE